MKTIKELENEVDHQSYKTRGKECYDKLVKVQALKEVLEIIDESQKDVCKQKNDQAIGWHNGLEELKQKIEGK